MFFHLRLKKNLRLEPRCFVADIKNRLIDRLHQEVEGRCIGRYGHIIAITKVESIGQGKIQEGTGCAVFPITYMAIVFRPIKNEVMYAVVTQVTQAGFVAESGPLQFYVSKQNMPSDMKFDPSIPAHVSDNQVMRIAVNSDVRLKVVASRIEANEIWSAGSIADDFLGPMT